MNKHDFKISQVILEAFLIKYRPKQVYIYTSGLNTFYYVTNSGNRHWLFNETITWSGMLVGGYYQVLKRTWTFPDRDFSLMPRLLFSSIDSFTFINLGQLFRYITNVNFDRGLYGYRTQVIGECESAVIVFTDINTPDNSPILGHNEIH